MFLQSIQLLIITADHLLNSDHAHLLIINIAHCQVIMVCSTNSAGYLLIIDISHCQVVMVCSTNSALLINHIVWFTWLLVLSLVGCIINGLSILFHQALTLYTLSNLS